MRKYILRLDDACERRDVEKWDRIEAMLDKYRVKPLVAVIPHCEDTKMAKYQFDEDFWNRVKKWTEKGWEIALHGYNHVYGTTESGINPVNNKSEFAGEDLEVQEKKIRSGIKIFNSKGIEPRVFVAPAHTFDRKTLEALRSSSGIRIVSDTVAIKPYEKQGMIFVPQQSGRVRALPLDTVTYCYHPNEMEEKEFRDLDKFLQKNKKYFISFPVNNLELRKQNILDKILIYLYFCRRRCKKGDFNRTS